MDIQNQDKLVSILWDNYCDTNDPGYLTEYYRQLTILKQMRAKK